MRTFAEWTVWVVVFLTAMFFSLPTKSHDDQLNKKWEILNREIKVLCWLVFAGCIFTLICPVSKFHLLWWVLVATLIWSIMFKTGQKITFLALAIFWIYRFNLLGMSALPGNLRVAALVVAAIGLAGVILGPSQTIGQRSKNASAVLLAFAVPGYLILQLF